MREPDRIRDLRHALRLERHQRNLPKHRPSRKDLERVAKFDLLEALDELVGGMEDGLLLPCEGSED